MQQTEYLKDVSVHLAAVLEEPLQDVCFFEAHLGAHLCFVPVSLRSPSPAGKLRLTFRLSKAAGLETIEERRRRSGESRSSRKVSGSQLIEVVS